MAQEIINTSLVLLMMMQYLQSRYMRSQRFEDKTNAAKCQQILFTEGIIIVEIMTSKAI